MYSSSMFSSSSSSSWQQSSPSEETSGDGEAHLDVGDKVAREAFDSDTEEGEVGEILDRVYEKRGKTHPVVI